MWLNKRPSCICDERWYGILGGARRCGHVHLEKAGGSERAAGRGGLEKYEATAVTLWESLTEGFTEAVWTENAFWERQK